MVRIRPDDRAALEALYPPETFRRDALRNGVQNAPALQGLLILSDPDPAGAVEIRQAERSTAENDAHGASSFLAPFLSGDDAKADPDDDRPYQAFLDDTAAALRQRKPADTSSDKKLAGFHGG